VDTIRRDDIHRPSTLQYRLVSNRRPTNPGLVAVRHELWSNIMFLPFKNWRLRQTSTT
jgi:hypothetical protein